MEKEKHIVDFILNLHSHLHHGSVAQLVEHLTFNQGVMSSNLIRATILFAGLAELV